MSAVHQCMRYPDMNIWFVAVMCVDDIRNVDAEKADERLLNSFKLRTKQLSRYDCVKYSSRYRMKFIKYSYYFRQGGHTTNVKRNVKIYIDDTNLHRAQAAYYESYAAFYLIIIRLKTN